MSEIHDSLKSHAQVLRKGTGEGIFAFGQMAHMQVSPSHSGGLITLANVTVPPDNGPPYHVHYDQDELFFVRSGKFEFTCDGDSQTGDNGFIFFGPRDVPHTFKNIGEEPAVVSVLVVNGSFEQFFRECSLAMEAGAQMDEIIRISSEHGIHYLPPDTPRVGQSRRGARPKVVDAKTNTFLTDDETGGYFTCVHEESLSATADTEPVMAATDTLVMVESGAAGFTVGDEVLDASSGDSVWLPAGTTYSYRSHGEEPCRALIFNFSANQPAC